MTNPIKRMIINYRRLRIPTCATCAKCVGYHGEPRCTSARYLEHTNRLNCTNHAYALLENVLVLDFASTRRTKMLSDERCGGHR